MSATVGYEPGESTTGLFGGNSNWRGPIWFPINYLVVETLRRYARYFGDRVTLEYPTGSGIDRTPVLHGLIPFREYFHGDTGMGLGASHQTGWTGLVADLIISRQDRERP